MTAAATQIHKQLLDDKHQRAGEAGVFACYGPYRVHIEGLDGVTFAWYVTPHGVNQPLYAYGRAIDGDAAWKKAAAAIAEQLAVI